MPVAKLLDCLVSMLSVEKEIDILVAIVKAITTSFYHNSENVKVDVHLLESLSLNCLRRFEVRELDFGNFKE